MTRIPSHSRFFAKTHNISRRAFIAFGSPVLCLLAIGSGGIGYLAHYLNHIDKYPGEQIKKLAGEAMNTLFKLFPGLYGKIPWLPIGIFPTPVEEFRAPIGMYEGRLFVKRDDLSSPLYGGNKVRKLEHLLAEAALGNNKTIVTIGGIGSNHALATALHSQAMGFNVELSLFEQPVTSYVMDNLLGFLAAGAKLQYGDNILEGFRNARKAFKTRKNNNEAPYFIISGGTCRLGNIGYVTAALELAEQIRNGLIPEPDRIFVPVGTCGTAAGLIAGLKIAGLRTKVMGVRVLDSFPANSFMIRYYAQNVANYLHKNDPLVPEVSIKENDFELLTDYIGNGYGFPTLAGKRAIKWATPRLKLETTYSGKALAACLDYCITKGKRQTILFWNTYNSSHFPKADSLDGIPEQLFPIFSKKLISQTDLLQLTGIPPSEHLDFTENNFRKVKNVVPKYDI